MTIEEIIKRQKEHLTKAQIGELIQATERYKQLNASNRASAMRTLSDQYRATRRGLQNTGLAGRKGKLVSGQEKAARIRANEAYRQYNAGLRQIDNAYAQNRAARMANETARENQLAEIEKIQAENDKEAERINAEYEEWLRKKKAAEDEYKRQQKEIERLRAQQQAQQQQIRERIEEDRTEQSGVVQGNRIQRLAKDKHPQLETSDYARAAQEQAVQRAVNGYKQTQKVFRQQREADAMYDAMHPGSAITRAPHTDDYVMEQKRVENARQLKVSGASDAEVWFADAYGVSPNRYKTVKNENPELIKELTGAIQDLRTKNYDTVINSPGNIYDKHQAREDKAKAESAISKAAVAMGIDNAEMRKLYLMNDTQFAVSFAAAAALAAARQKYDSSDAIQDQMMMSGKSGAFNNATRDAEMRLAKFDQVRRLRYDTADKTLYYDTYPTDVQTKDAKTVRSFCAINQNTTPYAWANPKNENGENWYQAAQNGWKAENDGNTKYGALVNDWSLVGGRQGMRYQQTGKVAALLANVMPHFYDLADETGTYSNAFEDTHVQSWAVHNGISTADYYDYVRNSCVKAFYGNNASHEDYEQMDAMLALANLMTDEERARFNELANGSYGAFANEADEYFEYLYKNVLPERFKAYVDELNGVFTDTTYGKIGQSALSVLTNLGEGITGPIHTLTTNYNDSVSAQLGAMKYTTAQAARESVSKDFSPVGKFFYDTGMSMADSASVAVISSGFGKLFAGIGVPTSLSIGGKTINLAAKAGSVFGGSILGGSAFNSAYKEALDRGLSPEKARTVAVGQGFNEMLFESLSLDLLVSQFQKGGILKVSKNSFVNWFVNTMVQGGVEGSEEVFTDMANNLWDNKVNGIFSEELTKLREYIGNGMSYEDAKRKVDAEYAEQLGMSFLGGFVSGGVMGGGASFLGMVQNRGNEKVGKGLRQNSRVMNELRNFDFKSEYAQEILTQDKLTNQDVADLFNIRQQELLGQYESDIQQAVADGKITQEQADLLKKYEQNGVQIVKDGEVVANENGITVEQMPSVQDAIANLDNAARIQFLNNEEMRSLVQAVGGETAAVIEQSETAEREAERAYLQTVREINNDNTLSPELKQERLEAAERTRQNARSEASKIADAALTNKKGIGAKLETDGNGTVKVGKGSGKVTYDFSTKDNPGHQTVDSMTATEQSALRIAKIVAASRGDVNVKVEAEFVGEHANENGYYDRNTNTIHINLSGDNSVLWTLSHELTHHLANTDTEAYAALRTAIETALKDSKLTTTELEDRGFEYDLDRVDPYIAREGNLWDALVAFEREEHGYGKDAEEEVVARCCESFLGFDKFVKDFARKQYKSAKAVNKFIAQMNIDMQRVSEEARQSAAQRNVWNDESPENQILRQLTEIDKIANLWRIAVNAEAKKRQAAREETRASTMDYVEDAHGWGNGYDGYSMSNNARIAYENGEMPRSKWTKSAIIDRVREIDASKAELLEGLNADTLRDNLLFPAGWHHTSSRYNRTDFYAVSEEIVDSLTKEDVDSWERVSHKPTVKDAYRGDFDYIEWTGTKNHPKANKQHLTDVNIQEKGSFYIVTDDNGNVIVKKKINSNGTYARSYEEEARHAEMLRQIDKERIANSTEAANALYNELQKRGYERSYSGNIYEKGRKPSSFDYDRGIENFFKEGEQRLARNENGGYHVETWNGKEWVAEKSETRASTKDSVKRSDAEYLDLARRYESGDASVEAELRKAVDAAARKAGAASLANGRLKEYYHGTRSDFTSFDIDKSRRGTYGYGFYVSAIKDVASHYVGKNGKLLPLYIMTDNLASRDDHRITEEQVADIAYKLDIPGDLFQEQTISQVVANKSDADIIRMLENYLDDETTLKPSEYLKVFREVFGYDGLRMPGENIVWSNDLLKSADLVTYDNDGNIIPLSERFKTENEDIRYSLKDDVKQTDITEYEHFNEEKYANMSETERIEYREHIAEMQIRKEARERQIAIDRNRRIRRDLTAMLKRGNDRIVKMLANPTENSHVPVHLAQSVAEYAQRLNELLIADVNYVRDNPPSVEDVKAYIDEHGYNVDANRFVDFYTGRGWLANSGLPMTNWKLNVASWAKRGAPQNVSGRQKTGAEKIIDALNRSYADEETIAALKAEDPKFDPRGLLPVQYDENGHIVKDETLVKMIKGMDSIIQGKHISDLTEDELRFVMNTMRGVIHTVTEANKVTVQGEKRNVYRESRQMANEVNSATKVFGDKSNKITKFMNRYVIESLGLRRIAKLYSGSDENAVFVKMVDDLNAGALEQERIKQTLRGMFNEVTSKYAKEMDTWYGKNAEWIDTGFGFKITKGMRVSLAMHILNAQNLRNVEKAGLRIPDMAAYRKGSIEEAYTNGKVVRLTKAQAEQIVSNMTEAEKAYYEVAKEFFHKRSGFYINRTSLKLLGYSKAIVENYFPIQTDDAYRTVKYDDVRQTASVEHPGFLESRKGTANVMYLNDITAVVNRQIDGVAKYAGLAIPMRNWNNIMNAWLFEENEDGEWVRSDEGRAHDVLKRRMGFTNGKQGKSRAIIDYVDQFITDLTSPVVRDANENVHAAEFAAKITSNYVKAVLTLNARVALSQLASVPTAAAEIPWKYIVQSFGGNVEGHLNRNASNELIDQYTPIFAMRRAGTQTEVSEVMKRRGFADKAEQKLPGLLGWITAMDVAATRRLWYACERWVKGETDIPVGSDAFYKEVARRYNRVIQNTQPNFTVLQRSPALRSKSAAARIITMFGTQRMQNAGVFIESLAEVVQTKDKVKRKAAMKKFGRTLSGLITAAIVIGLERALVSALRGRMRPLQDDDKDITVGSVSKYIMGEIGTSLAGSFMYVGELYDFVHGVVGGLTDGDSGYETSFALPAAEALSTTIKFFKDKDWQYFEYMRGDHTDHEKWLKTRSFVNELMTVASYVTGLPLANASKTILNGTVPLVQDIVESTKTGELNLYLHQSGKLDSANTAANYKEWTNLGKKGSVYLAWENRFKEDKSKGLDHRAELLFEDSVLTADEKAILLRMSNSTKDNPLTSKDGVVYKDDGTVVVDFTNLDRYRASTMLSDKQYEGFLNLVDMGVAEDVASTAFIQYNVQKKQGSGANDRFRDWLFNTIKNPEDRAKVDMAVVGNTVRVEGTIGYKENGEVYADYSSKEMFDLYTSGKKQQKSDAIISTTDTPEAKAKAFADTDNDYHAKGGIVYNDKDKVVADFTSDEAYRASQMGESHYAKYTDAVKQGMSKENAILAVEKHKEFTNDDDKDNATQYATWVFNTYKSAKDRAIAGAIYTTKPVTIKDGRTYDENGYIYRDYTSAAWYKLSNRTLSSDGTNKRYEAAKKLVDTGLTAERIVEIYEGTTGMSKKSEWKEYLKSLKLTNEQIDIFMKSRWK